MKNNIFCTISLLISSVTLTAQELLPLPLRQKEELEARSWVRETPFKQVIVKEIGNRISALNINPKNSNEFVVAPENGGVWLTQNGGETYRALCPTLPTQSITALAMDWESGTLAIGTPYGIFISTDKGQTTLFKGLAGVQQISSLYINPANPQELVVGVLGNRYKADEKRGIFKTTDGGNTWQQKQFISNVKERAIGKEVMESLTPAHQVIKIVNEELTALIKMDVIRKIAIDRNGVPRVLLDNGIAPKKLEYETVICPSCAAKVTKIVGERAKCEYCGNDL